MLVLPGAPFHSPLSSFTPALLGRPPAPPARPSQRSRVPLWFPDPFPWVRPCTLQEARCLRNPLGPAHLGTTVRPAAPRQLRSCQAPVRLTFLNSVGTLAWHPRPSTALLPQPSLPPPLVLPRAVFSACFSPAERLRPQAPVFRAERSTAFPLGSDSARGGGAPPSLWAPTVPGGLLHWGFGTLTTIRRHLEILRSLSRRSLAVGGRGRS